MIIRNQIKQVNAVLSGTMDLYRMWAKKYHINYNALVVLYTLDEYQACTQKQICQCWALPKQTVHGILLDYEKKGYITITVHEKDKRERIVTFTESGRQFASSILEKLHRMEESAMEKLGEEKRKQLVSCNTEYYELLMEEIQNGSYIK